MHIEMMRIIYADEVQVAMPNFRFNLTSILYTHLDCWELSTWPPRAILLYSLLYVKEPHVKRSFLTIVPATKFSESWGFIYLKPIFKIFYFFQRKYFLNGLYAILAFLNKIYWLYHTRPNILCFSNYYAFRGTFLVSFLASLPSLITMP